MTGRLALAGQDQASAGQAQAFDSMLATGIMDRRAQSVEHKAINGVFELVATANVDSTFEQTPGKCCKAMAKCISRESNLGHIDGKDVFYHSTTAAVGLVAPRRRSTASPISAVGTIGWGISAL